MTISLQDVARAAGVGLGTASRALSGRGKVAAATRVRVRAAAEELGYQSNAAAALLASNRGKTGERLRVADVDLKHNHSKDLKQAAELMGLDLDRVDLSGFRNPSHLLRSLWNRGVDGLYVNFNNSIWTEAEWKAADWSRFSVIKRDRLFPELPFHLVRHSAFDYMRESLRQVIASGAKNIAVLLYESGSEADDEARLGAVLAADQRLREQGGRVRARVWGQKETVKEDPECMKWLEKIQPDVILSFVWLHWYPLRRAGWRFPEDAGFAAVLRPHPEEMGEGVGEIAGCETGNFVRHRNALEHLREMMGRGERGIPPVAMEYVIEPQWVEGRTLKNTVSNVEHPTLNVQG